MKSTVYFIKSTSPTDVVTLYEKLGKHLSGNVAIKIHSGEVGNQNFLKPDFWRPIIERVGGTVVECNTAYDGSRGTTEKHRRTLTKHGWSPVFGVEILDASGPDIELDIPFGKMIKKNYVGRGIEKYDSILVLSHFKGHPMGGFGGAVKQLSIGFASSTGKKYIHGAGDLAKVWDADHDSFLTSMADAASSVVKMFGDNAIYVNAMMNMSVDCDCCAVAEDPCMKDVGIFISTDPVAIDKACLDTVYASCDPGRDKMIERIESRNGALTLDVAAELDVGSLEYELIEI